MDNDELKIYHGQDFKISDHIVVHQPTLGEICEYGEKDYYSMIYQLTATPQTLKAQLWDMGIDFTTLTPYELFYSLIYHLYPAEKTSIIFGDVDLQRFQVMKRTDDNSVVLYQTVQFGDTEEIVVIDEYTYEVIMDYLRKMHCIIKDEWVPANNAAKIAMIEDAKDEHQKMLSQEYHSHLLNYISAMTNSEGFKLNYFQVWDMKIYSFMDAVKRVSKIKNVNLLMQSGYSGFGVNLENIDKKQIDWIGPLE